MFNIKYNKLQSGALALLAMLGISSASGQTTPKPAYPTPGYAWAKNAAELYAAVDRANNSGANPYYIRLYGSETIKLTKPIELTKGKKYVFWKKSGTAKKIIDGQYGTPFLATRNGGNPGQPYPEAGYRGNPRGQSVDLFNIQIFKCRNFVNRQSGDGRGTQKWPGGGAISINFADVRLVDCTFLNNQAVWPANRRGEEACSEIVSGGAVRTSGGSLKVWNCFFQNNIGLTGGAVHTRYADAECYNTGFNNNGARGGIDAFYSGTLDWNTEGGAWRVDEAKTTGGKTFVFRDSYFNNNWTESLVPLGVNMGIARNYNSSRNKRPPNEAQNGIAFNIWCKNRVGGSNTAILDMRRCNFTGNKRGHVAAVRINDVTNWNPIVMNGCNFWNNGSADNKDYRDNNQYPLPNAVNDKTRFIVWNRNGSAWESFSGSTIHSGNVFRNWSPTGYGAD